MWVEKVFVEDVVSEGLSIGEMEGDGVSTNDMEGESVFVDELKCWRVLKYESISAIVSTDEVVGK